MSADMRRSAQPAQHLIWSDNPPRRGDDLLV